MEPHNQNTTTPPHATQEALPGVPGPIQLANGLDDGTRVELAADADAAQGPDYHPAQGALPYTGVLPGARWRRESAGGSPVSWTQLDVKLDEIDTHRGGAWIWETGPGAAAMPDVEAQTYRMADVGRRVLGLPGWARGPWVVHANEERLLAAIWSAYEAGSGGLYDCQSTIAADLGFSERTLRHLLHGTRRKVKKADGTIEVVTREGLISRGLVRARQTWRQGVGERPSDHHWLLLRLGPEVERYARAACFEHRHRPPRRAGIKRDECRAAMVEARAGAAAIRFEGATAAWEARHRPRGRGGPPTAVPIRGPSSAAPRVCVSVSGRSPAASDFGPGLKAERSGAGSTSAAGSETPAAAGSAPSHAKGAPSVGTASALCPATVADNPATLRVSKGATRGRGPLRPPEYAARSARDAGFRAEPAAAGVSEPAADVEPAPERSALRPGPKSDAAGERPETETHTRGAALDGPRIGTAVGRPPPEPEPAPSSVRASAAAKLATEIPPDWPESLRLAVLNAGHGLTRRGEP